MKYLILIILSLLLTGTSRAQCSGPVRTHANLHWSEEAKVSSPDRVWEVKVHPVLDADENRSPVTIRKCGESKSWPLFTLQRSAEVFWSPDSKHVLVVNQPLSGTNRLLLFPVPGSPAQTSEPASDDLDKTVTETLAERLGKGKHVQFYLPTLVSWRDSSMLLAVGGETYLGDSGPLDTYCYGLRINSSTLHVESVLSERELKASTGHACHVSP
ncbi:hypothetical protein HNQ77_002659 [Silvibacterium bohemicum]|uniref:Uncharacterized protein n=1 Tax=Silvibacterium bohemicum TaxID=1577686 RepID=A0A841JTH1_9BACT|nr:hypothetical protein [Silvibacterium bohemicum]